MTTPRRIRLQALASAQEAAIVSQAARQLSGALGSGYRVEAEFPSSLATLDRAAEPCIVVTSLSAEAEAIDEAWDIQEERLGRLFHDLTADARVLPYVCTVFRHVVETADPEERRRRLRRIRRLNLLAAELSRRTGVHVVDFDRALADIGAQALATDHRLGGHVAVVAAGACLSRVVLTTGLDAVLSYSVQEAAAEALAGQPLPVAELDPGPSSALAVALARPRGRVSGGGPEARVREMLKGKLSMAEAIQTLTRAVSRRGLAPALALAFAGARRVWRSRALERR